ncbi:disease resistance protein Roq1-like [Mangifera indica]|uniref:disease resistance protein Roq1-like n=1 Tax=Mangifera indica TaxID=29780 RepID=UPI001CF9B415|nr:disease resistance protein Roq1-like [Mangifera indica]
MRNQRDSSSSPDQLKYDVFLNFQSEGTGKKFTHHLCAALDRERIKVFKGDNALDRERIEDSRISIIVFSKSYASSIQCLDELVKIVECENTMGQIVIPIFYDVEPRESRRQEGVFEEAFSRHEETFKENTERVQTWRKSLKVVSNISGFHLKDGDEAELIKVIVKEISSKLSSSTSSSTSTSTSTSASTSASASSNLIDLKRLVTASATGVITCLENLVMQAHTHTLRVSGANRPLTHLPLFFFFFKFLLMVNLRFCQHFKSFVDADIKYNICPWVHRVRVSVAVGVFHCNIQSINYLYIRWRECVCVCVCFFFFLFNLPRILLRARMKIIYTKL